MPLLNCIEQKPNKLRKYFCSQIEKFNDRSFIRNKEQVDLGFSKSCSKLKKHNKKIKHCLTCRKCINKCGTKLTGSPVAKGSSILSWDPELSGKYQLKLIMMYLALTHCLKFPRLFLGSQCQGYYNLFTLFCMLITFDFVS